MATVNVSESLNSPTNPAIVEVDDQIMDLRIELYSLSRQTARLKKSLKDLRKAKTLMNRSLVTEKR